LANLGHSRDPQVSGGCITAGEGAGPGQNSGEKQIRQKRKKAENEIGGDEIHDKDGK
jgi:hypothetical protein